MPDNQNSQPSPPQTTNRPVRINEEKGLQPPASPPPPMPTVQPPKE